MAERKHGTGVEWTHVPGYVGETWNPQIGCSKKSPACENCYAIDVAAHPRLTRLPRYQGLTVLQQSGPNWARDERGTPIIRRVPEVLDKPLRTRRPTAYFVGSMTDLFHENADFDWIAAIFGVMAACPQHLFMLLTKRPDVARRWYGWIAQQSLWGDESTPCGGGAGHVCWARACRMLGKTLLAVPAPVPWPLPNVWIGTTCEDQKRADERLGELVQLPAAIRYVSFEPALGPTSFRPWLRPRLPGDPPQWKRSVQTPDGPRDGIDWIIAGGESGQGARPSLPDWFRAVRDECAAAKVPFFFKQWGEWASASEVAGAGPHYQFPDGATVRRVGKKRAGRLLDGVEHSAWPEVRP